jgi:HAD superfamily hydrolase (TIGR01484 family)
VDRLLVCDIDGTFAGEAEAAAKLLRQLRLPGAPVLAYATGRQSYSATSAIAEYDIDQGSYLISGVGSEIYRRVGGHWFPMATWPRLSAPWDDARIRLALRSVGSLVPQAVAVESPYKLSYVAPPSAVDEVRARLAQIGVEATITHSHGELLDVLPAGIDKGSAVAWLADSLGIPLERVMTCGNSANDTAMLRLACPSVVVSGSEAELLAEAPDLPQTFVAPSDCAWGILDGLRHFGWWDGTAWR